MAGGQDDQNIERRGAHLDSVLGDEAGDADGARLAEAVDARQCLLLHRHAHARLQQEHMACCAPWQMQPLTSRVKISNGFRLACKK